MAYSESNDTEESGYDVSEAGGFSLGDVVSWDGGEGRIEHLMVDGVLGLAGSPFAINADKENPAALLRVYRMGEPTEYLVGKPVAALSRYSRSGGMRLGRNGRR